ncbi:MAG TPA: ATP-binding cassette domain-containing protein [Acidimicrobiia bacterium]|jgi:energy-coupling factor transport system ATP-binding protein
MSTLTYEAVRYTYGEAPGPALDHVELAVGDGELVLVVGGSGSGKSTMLRAANGIVPHLTGGTFAGTVRVAGRSTREYPPRKLADVVGFVHQDPESQFVVDHVESDVAFVVENLGFDPATMRRRVEEALDALAIAHLRDREASTLSGGERQRVAIAGALAAAPSCLVLDEPTSQLDPQGAEDVLGALARLNTDLGTTVLIAEHRLDRAAPLADRCVMLDAGRVVADGTPQQSLAGYDGAPVVLQLARALGWTPLPLTVKQARLLAAQWPPANEIAVPGARFDGGDHTAPAPGEAIVRARGVHVRYGASTAVHDVDCELRAGEVVALLGRNGSGKSTLLRALAGLQRLGRGSVEVSQGERVAYVPQDPNALLSAPTVRAEIDATLRLLDRDRRAGTAEQWIERLALGDLVDRHPRTLSGGERQRLAIAAVAVGGARALLLDEPTRGMDAASRTALERAIREHADGGGAVMLATHDVELASRVATRVVVLGDGDIVADGPARRVLAGSLFAPQTLRVLPPLLTVDEAVAWASAGVAR